MRVDADFMVYVGARWPALVRSLVLLGCPPGEAPYVATDALSRCRRGWDEVSRNADVDRFVQDELEAAWARRRSRTPSHATPSSDTELQELAEGLTVLAPPTLDDLRALDRVRRRTSTRRALVLLVPVLLVVGGLTWWTTRSGDERPRALGPAELTRAEDEVGVAWHGNGELHLRHAVLDVGPVHDLTEIGTGAVYRDDQDRVVYVADDGGRTVLGHTGPYLPVLAADENGWAAWVETEGEDAGSIVVKDAARDQPVGTLEVAGPEPRRVVALDGDTVFFADGDGTHAWLPVGGTVAPVTPAELLDVRSRIKAFQIAPVRIQVVQSMFLVVHDLPGTGARLTRDGNFVATRTDRRTGGLTVYDTRSGDPVRVGLAGWDIVLDVETGRPGEITYVVQGGGDLQRELRTCELRTAACTAVDVPPGSGVPVLAR